MPVQARGGVVGRAESLIQWTNTSRPFDHDVQSRPPVRAYAHRVKQADDSLQWLVMAQLDERDSTPDEASAPAQPDIRATA